ncbi:hypothetical protein [Ruegeria sp. HKCCE4150]|uniref:hypothetical protein n=1 Tax=Ruegeria sp. HKCCE4150 TaxID=2794828 RepID=UPI00147FD249|nr:hypothetical protein [Ruegeria sp. HKCCE4150]
MRRFIPDQRQISFEPCDRDFELRILEEGAAQKLSQFIGIGLDGISQVIRDGSPRDKSVLDFMHSLKCILSAAHGGDSWDVFCGNLPELLKRGDPHADAAELRRVSVEAAGVVAEVYELIEKARNLQAKADKIDHKLDALCAAYKIGPTIDGIIGTLDAFQPSLDDLYFLVWMNGGQIKRVPPQAGSFRKPKLKGVGKGGRPPKKIAFEIAYEAIWAAVRHGRGNDIKFGHDADGQPTSDLGGFIDGLFGVLGVDADFREIGPKARARFEREIESDLEV